MAAKRQPVAKGGIWSTQPAPMSKETQQLLKVMMEESKLTNFQRRQLSDKMTKGQSLPVSVNPTTSQQGQRPRQTSAAKKPLPKVMNARHLSGGKRSKEVIEVLHDTGEEPYRPAPTKYISTEEKRKLQNVMAYGEHGKEIGMKKPAKPASKSMEEVEVDRFDEVLQEIEERKQFLEEMESLGQGKKYRTVINTEISQKIRELELIDKKRSQELDVAIKEQNESPGPES
ncbi:predicted protein [Nematostella vectensis]|uniref:Uncharacterized protein n=1 Tax=Nematostella vectensis TaxID=45351 RepID=A7SHG6_NEMVE|nr:UPF0193 protein EVG1 [Nematostella vectensis]EDO36841.1 predicted protein [Nematostella vectensis]|eukprot:XP_001628904.1 predicted protein [Nematostella vectensis]